MSAAHVGGHMARGDRQRPEGGAPGRPEPEGLRTIGAGQGARVTTRENAAEAAELARRAALRRHAQRRPEGAGHGPSMSASARPSQARTGARAGSHAAAGASSRAERRSGPARSPKRVMALVACAVLALALVALLGRFAVAAMTPGPAEQAQMQQGAQGDLAPQPGQEGAVPQESPEQQVGVDGTISYQGDTYALGTSPDSGRRALLRTTPGDERVVFEVEGEPRELMLAGDTILVPEDRDGGWDVVCYVMGGHADPSYVSTEQGVVRGEGSISSVRLSGTTLTVKDSQGRTTDVALS